MVDDRFGREGCLKHMAEIDLSYNKICNIADRFFRNFKSLQYLDLSYNR